MSPTHRETNNIGRYDQALHYARDHRLPAGFISPRPTKEWPPENIALLDRYVDWLRGGGASEEVIRTIYIPMAGHVLGLNLKPHKLLDLDSDLSQALEYVKAKQMGPDWTDVCRVSLEKFRRFMLNDRGQIQVKYKPFDAVKYAEGLPLWVVRELERYQLIKQRNWREMRLEESKRRFWQRFVMIWRYLVETHHVQEIKDIKRQHLYAYAEMRLSTGHAATGVNGDIRSFHGFLGFLQDEGYEIPQSLLHWQGLKEPDRLPRFLPDDQVKRLRDEFENRVLQANSASTRRNSLLDRATFYLLWQSGLRRGEVEDLRLEDLNIEGKRLTVRLGKNLKDRTVFMTNTTVCAVKEYLAVRGIGPTDHVFLYRNQPLSKDLIHGRLKLIGDLVGVKVHAHRLRHTCATQLLNAGCKITSIQKFLGHKKLNSTMIYARVHDQTVAEDYYTAMNRVEQRLELADQPKEISDAIWVNTQTQLIMLVEQLFTPQLEDLVRFELADQLKKKLCSLAKMNIIWDTKTQIYNRISFYDSG
jgi:site-specific recombinase XerD